MGVQGSSFKSLGCQEGHQRHPYPPSLELDPWRTCWFLMHTVWIVDVLEVSCFKFQLSVTSGTPSKTPLSTISWLDPWRTCWFLMHTVWIVDVLEVSCFKFQLSVTSGTPSK